jgi:uncharacterized protein (TIGR02246 family)
VSGPLDTVTAYLAAFNSGDVEAMAAQFAPTGSILDGMAPHSWVGPEAARMWYADVLAESAHWGASDYHVTIGTPLHNSITRNTAYVVVPAVMSYYLDGRLRTQDGAHFTIALERKDGSWLIAAWAWTKGLPTW